MKSFGVPNVRLHPLPVLLLTELELIEQEAKLASMATALTPRKYLSFIGLQLVKSLESDPHRDAVIIVCHAASTQMSCDQLDLHLSADFGLEDVGEVSKFVRPAADELMQVNELWNLLFRGR